MDTDIRDEIERSFGDGPPFATTEDLLGRGRRALRRRRLAEAAATAAVAVLVVGGAAVATGGGEPDATPQPMAPSTTAPPTGSVPSASTGLPDFPPPLDAQPISDESMTSDWPIEIQQDGVHVWTRVELLRLVDDPWRLRSDGRWSAAASYRDEQGEVVWWAAYADADLGGASVAVPAAHAGDASFAAWVEHQAALAEDAPPPTSASPAGGWPGMTGVDLVRFAGDAERLEPLEAVTLIEQHPHPDLPPSWAAADDRSAVAEVEFEGARYYVLARQLAGDRTPQYITVKAAKGGATLDDFLALARERYAEGGGGLL